MPRILFTLLVTAVVGAYLYVLFRRLLSLFPTGEHSRIRLWLPILPALALALLCTNMFSAPFIALAHFLVIALLMELLNLVFKRIKAWRFWPYLFKSSALSLVICGLYLTYGYFNMQHIQSTAYTLPDAPVSSTIKLVFISDLHMGTTMEVDDLQEYCRAIEQQKVDMVLLGGDIVDESTTQQQLEGVAQAFGDIDCSYGTYFIFGNHDSFTGSHRKAAITRQDLENAFSANGIAILEDSSVQLPNGIRLVGRADASFTQDRERASLDELLDGAQPDEFVILLDHQPLQLEQASRLGVDLMLSGHTHGGQFWPGGLINQLAHTYELLYGEKTVNGMTAITSSGMGGWCMNLRTGSHSEIVYITVG